MKRILAILSILFASITAKAQTVVFADPAIGYIDIVSPTGAPVNANVLEQDSTYKIVVTIYNLDQTHDIPSATCRIRVGLGTKLILSPGYVVGNSPLNNYFSWTTQVTSQTQVYGDLILTLPADFTGTLTFPVKATILGTSTASGQFLISNNNPAYTLSDTDPNNNGATINYTIVHTIPVKFISVVGKVQDCIGWINWKVGVEDNIDHYELEYSNDGVHFSKCNSIAAIGVSSYTITAKDIILKSSTVFFRVKSVDRDGSFAYSDIILLKGFCYEKDNAMLDLYPNPIKDNIITVKFQIPEGLYDLMVFDAIGQAVFNTKILHPGNQGIYKITFDQELSAGSYYAVLLGKGTRLSKKFIKE